MREPERAVAARKEMLFGGPSSGLQPQVLLARYIRMSRCLVQASTSKVRDYPFDHGSLLINMYQYTGIFTSSKPELTIAVPTLPLSSVRRCGGRIDWIESVSWSKSVS